MVIDGDGGLRARGGFAELTMKSANMRAGSSYGSPGKLSTSCMSISGKLVTNCTLKSGKLST